MQTHPLQRRASAKMPSVIHERPGRVGFVSRQKSMDDEVYPSQKRSRAQMKQRPSGNELESAVMIELRS